MRTEERTKKIKQKQQHWGLLFFIAFYIEENKGVKLENGFRCLMRKIWKRWNNNMF